MKNTNIFGLKKSKKSLVMMDAIVYGAITVVTILVLVFVIPPLIGKGGAAQAGILSKTNDCDGDGTADYFDKCMCLYGLQNNDGCPPGVEVTGSSATEREKKCQEKCNK